MEDADIVDQQSIHRVRNVTRRTARRVVSVAVLAGFGAGLLVAALVYAVYGPERLSATWWILAVFPGLGLYQALHWWRHYRCILQQLDALEARVERGEVLYGSQAKFHSYR
jgi:hypothetical protein